MGRRFEETLHQRKYMFGKWGRENIQNYWIIGETHIKDTPRYHCAAIRTCGIQEANWCAFWQGCGGTGLSSPKGLKWELMWPLWEARAVSHPARGGCLGPGRHPPQAPIPGLGRGLPPPGLAPATCPWVSRSYRPRCLKMPWTASPPTHMPTPKPSVPPAWQ